VGDSDQIADADYGRAYADAIPGAVFQLLAETGHLPQIETPSSCWRPSRRSPALTPAGLPADSILRCILPLHPPAAQGIGSAS